MGSVVLDTRCREVDDYAISIELNTVTVYEHLGPCKKTAIYGSTAVLCSKENRNSARCPSKLEQALRRWIIVDIQLGALSADGELHILGGHHKLRLESVSEEDKQ
jgi:hypothetical protein